MWIQIESQKNLVEMKHFLFFQIIFNSPIEGNHIAQTAFILRFFNANKIRMKLRSLVLLFFIPGCFLSFELFAQANPDAILGIWFNEEKDAKIKIYKENGEYFGKVVWRKAEEGTSDYDVNNPDPELQKRKKVGLVILTDFKFDDGQWEDGEIYDPKSGKTYSCVIKLQKDGSLHVRGYVGISLLGRTTQWTKAE